MSHLKLLRVDVKVQSIVKYLPSEEKNDDHFAGIVSVPNTGVAGPICTSSGRAEQIETQKKDAEDRVVAWTVEDSRLTDMDAEGEDDPEYFNDSGIVMLGRRNPDGTIEPLQERDDDAMDMDEAEVQFFGHREPVPSHVGKLVRKRRRSFLHVTYMPCRMACARRAREAWSLRR